MIHNGKKNVCGILIDEIDYEGAIEYVIRAAKERRAASISALAVHGLMTGALVMPGAWQLMQRRFPGSRVFSVCESWQFMQRTP